MKKATSIARKVGCVCLAVFLMASLMSADLDVSAHENPFHVPYEDKGFGDPYILKHNGVYYLYGTVWPEVHVWASRDLVSWAYRGPCMQGDNAHNPYAPEVRYFDGVFYMCAAPDGGGNYIYTSSSPTGPFTVASENLGFRFDGNVMMDTDNRLYFTVPSTNGMCGMYMSDFLTVDRSNVWKIPVGIGPFWTEGPTMFKRLGKYYLTYTGNKVWQNAYQVQYALSDSPDKGWTEPADNILLLDVEGDLRGLGHNSIFVGPDLDTYYITYHNLYDIPKPTSARRYVNFDKIVWNGDKLVVQGPTSWEVDDPELPAFYDYFDIGDTSAWSVYEKWIGQDGGVRSNKGMLLTRQSTADVFSAEFNFTLGGTGNSGSVLFGYKDDRNYGRVWLDPSAGTVNLQIIRNGLSACMESLPLYEDFNYTALHTVRVQQSADTLRVLLDEVERFVVQESVGGGRIGYRTYGVPLTAHYTAFSNKALGSADGENDAPVPGTVEAVHFANTDAALPTVSARGDELGNAIRLQADARADYNVNVKEAATYSLALSVADVADGTMVELLLDGKSVGTVTLPAVAASSYYRSLPLRGLSLPQGKHQLSLRVLSGSLELYELRTATDAAGTTFSDDFSDEADEAWLRYEQNPSIVNGTVGYVSATPAFGKLLVGSLTDTDYVLEADIRIDSTRSSAGFLFRVTHVDNGYNPEAGVENPTYHQGYYLGLREGQLSLYKHSFGEASLLTTVSDTRLKLGQTLHVRIEAIGDTYTVLADGERLLAYTDTSHPYLTGRAGLRTYQSVVNYDNFSLTPTDGLLSLIPSKGEEEAPPADSAAADGLPPLLVIPIAASVTAAVTGAVLLLRRKKAAR